MRFIADRARTAESRKKGKIIDGDEMGCEAKLLSTAQSIKKLLLRRVSIRNSELWSHRPCTFLNKLKSSKSSGVNVLAIFSDSR